MKYLKKGLNVAPLAIFSIFAAVLLLAGCFVDEPSKDHVRNVIEPELHNTPLEILKLESKWIKTGEVTWEGKAEVSLRLKEDCYISASLNDELTVLKLDHAETAALRQALSLVAVQAGPVRSSLLEKAPKPLEEQSFITLSEKAGTPLSATFPLTARKKVDGWELKIQDASCSPALRGRSRSTMPAGSLVVGSPDAERLVKEGIEAIRQYAALVDQAEEARKVEEARREVERKVEEARREVERKAEEERRAEEMRLAAERQAAERQRQEDAYQAALAEAIAPGKAFQGAWIQSNQRGELGLFIENVSADGISCAGYFFDPTDRSKRKPFTATINRTFGAQDALNVTATRGRGVVAPEEISSWQLSTMHRLWLGVTAEHSSKFALSNNGGWIGHMTTGRTALDLAPLLNFAELLAQDQVEEEKRKEAARDAVRPGTEYINSLIPFAGGLIGMRILTLDGSTMTFTAELFDPQEPAVTWPHNGSISFKEGHAIYTLTYNGRDHSKFNFQGSGNKCLARHLIDNKSELQLVPAPTAESLYGEINPNRYPSLKLEFNKSKAPAASEAAPPVPTTASPTAPAPTSNSQAAQPSYSPLTATDGKPKAAAHLVRLENDAAELALQVLAPGKTLEAIRIDNMGGVPSLWRSDSRDKAAPLAVNKGGKSISSGAQAMTLALGDTEALFSLSLKDNGAFAGKSTEFRVTIFFVGGKRVMCMLKVQ